MPRREITYLRGRISELSEQLQRLRISTDAVVKALLYHFDPIDNGLDYVDAINTERLEVYVSDIKKYTKEICKIKQEVDRLKGEVGQDNVG
jgi:SMC interacting uncharacterized protein involved in chromosome segregation